MVPLETIKEVQKLAQLSAGREICGLISKDLQLYPIRNVSQVPANSFVFDKREYIEALQEITEEGILCIYHSHAFGPPLPSQKDLAFIKASKHDSLIVTASDYRWIYAP